MANELSPANPHSSSRLFAWAPFLVLALLACAIGATGYFVFSQYQQRVQKEAHETLDAIADLRVNQVAEWREAYKKNAEVMARDTLLAMEIERWLQRGTPLDPGAQRIAQRLKAVQQAYDFQGVFILDERGVVLDLPITPDAKPPTAYGVKLVMEAMRTKQAILTDLHPGAEAPRVRLDLVVPIFAHGDARNRAIAGIYFRIDPQRYLFPLLQSWPTPSPSAEAMLVRREGAEVVILNNLRHRSNTALQLRFPVTEKKLLAAMMARGKGGLIEGVDYRGIPVIGAAKNIPDSPWFLVAKMDKAELYAPIRRTAWIVAVLVFAFIARTGGGAGLWWRQQRAQFLVRYYEGKLKRQVLEQKYNALTRYANDIILMMDDTGRIIEANERAIQAYGHSRDELLRMNVRDLQAPEALASFDVNWDRCGVEGLVYETVHRYADQSVFPVEVSARLIETEGKHFRQAIIRDITERKSYESQLERQANYDELTGLANRNLFQDRLNQALIFSRRHECGLAVLFIDLDNFKNINDSLGHDAGDALLTQVASRLTCSVREGDTVARLGGDEFVLLLSEIRAEDDVSAITQKLLKAMSAPFDIGGHELHITCSIGIASYPKDGKDRQTLLKNADAAMYRAKDLGRNNAQFYAAEMNVKAMERLMLESGLRHALERNEFLLHYQPQVDLRTGEITGMEALVRWQHPELGLVSPARFIPVAEESGLIVPLGEWVLRTACAQNKAWQRAGLKPISVAVNLSARQFRQPNLVEVVAGILRETELDPAHLELELTESLVMQNVEVTIATLDRLKAMGIKLSIDDFGTGYSSLSYLKRFPIHTLKIDQSFVRDITTDPSDAAIAKTIIAMAHELGLMVIAEGVETEEQKSFLQQRHCDEMQGFFFSKPVPATEFEILLREGRCLQNDEAAADLSQRTLLLLDDEENILTSLTRLLRRDGYKILKATNAAAALDLLAQNPVGVIISDQRMPEMSGVEFLRRVKQIYPDTVRMVLSGYTDLKSVTDAINEGAVYKFLTKPWEDDLLRANIQEAFQRYELVRNNQRLSEEMTSINEELNRAKLELEKRVEQKTGEARHNIGVLQVSQEMLEYLPVGVIGMSEDGLIAVANRKANELFYAGNKQPLVGCFAAERLPGSMVECLAGGGEHHAYQFENGRNVIFWCHSMGASSGSEGRVLVIVPNEQDGD